VRHKVFMPFSRPQLRATFLSRPQRFLAQMVFPDGTQTLAYCANPGSFHGCLQPGSAALLWDSEDAKRKRRYTWRAIKLDGIWVGTDTHLANRLVEKALQHQLLPCLTGYEIVERELLVSAGLRMDFVLTGPEGVCFLEVKSATVAEKGVARFPDSITPRGLKHLECLTRKAEEGHRAVLLFVVQRNDVQSFTVSNVHYPAYAKAFQKALTAGVETLACAVHVSPAGFGKPRLLRVCYG
jgi:sugar fermentation stimulation protein A